MPAKISVFNIDFYPFEHAKSLLFFGIESEGICENYQNARHEESSPHHATNVQYVSNVSKSANVAVTDSGNRYESEPQTILKESKAITLYWRFRLHDLERKCKKEETGKIEDYEHPYRRLLENTLNRI